MAPLPEHVAERLRTVTEATGHSPQTAWNWQSKATRAAANPVAWRKCWHGLTPKKRAALKNRASWWLRPKQLTPVGAWFIWFLLAGRGWGKTHCGATWVIEQARKDPKSRGALVGATAADVRDTMILGPSGILALSPPGFVPDYEPSKGLLTWPNGARCKVYTADKPARLRGPNLNWAWVDELAAFRYPQQAWDMLMFCMRRGRNPQVVVTTTPRPINLIRTLWKRCKDKDPAIHLTRGSSWENWFHLPKRWFEEVVAKAKGHQRREEVEAEVLDSIEGAWWHQDAIDRQRVNRAPELSKVVVAVDPASSNNPDSDEHGIVAVGRGYDLHAYTIADRSRQGSPSQWARTAYELYLELDADCIVVERNTGGDMAAHTIRTVVRQGEPRPRIKEVVGKKGKLIRATPVVALHEEGRQHMVGEFPELEHEKTNFVQGVSTWSPNRLDAEVWATLELFPTGHVAN